MKCLFCGKEFTPKRADAKFCSSYCRLAYFRKKENEQINKGFVYVIQCQEFYKIGFTSNLMERIKSIETANPYEIKVIFSVFIKEPFKLEHSLHTCFAPKRIKGEWFKLDDKDLKLTARILIDHYLNDPSNFLKENPRLIEILNKSKMEDNFSEMVGKTLG